jgi:hypothetical protein
MVLTFFCSLFCIFLEQTINMIHVFMEELQNEKESVYRGISKTRRVHSKS